MDTKIFKTLVRSETDGIYRPANKTDYILAIPKEAQTGESFGGVGAMDAQLGGTQGSGGSAVGAGAPAGAQGQADSRAPAVGAAPQGDAGGGAPAGGGGPGGGGGGGMNFTRRDYAIRHISDWIGDKGWLYSMSWGGLYAADMQVSGEPSPVVNPETKKYIDMVPKELYNTTKVLGEGKGDSKFVIVKSVVSGKYVRDGEFFVDLVWWVEPIGGGNWGEGVATVKLPSKKAK